MNKVAETDETYMCSEAKKCAFRNPVKNYFVTTIDRESDVRSFHVANDLEMIAPELIRQ